MQEAQRYYKTATKLDETSVAALSGIVACQLLDKQLDQDGDLLTRIGLEVSSPGVERAFEAIRQHSATPTVADWLGNSHCHGQHVRQRRQEMACGHHAQGRAVGQRVAQFTAAKPTAGTGRQQDAAQFQNVLRIRHYNGRRRPH